MAGLPDCLKQALDCVLSVPYTLGLRPYQVFVTKITYTGSRPGLGTRTRTDTELLVGDGYPPVEQVSAHDIFLSGGLLNDKDFKITIVAPYDTGTVSGGTSRDIFDPPMSNNNTQIYFHIFGGHFPSTGQYFKRKYGIEDGNLTNYIFIEATAEIPGT
jgi:hypothetical protein